MPELPDLSLYVSAIAQRIVGDALEGFRLASPFVLRSVEPPPSAAVGRRAVGVSRVGKRVVVEFEGHLYFVFHLMIAGRFRWKTRMAAVPSKIGLLALDFSPGTLQLTEAGSKRRASLHVVAGRLALAQHDPGGIEVMSSDLPSFTTALRRRNHTLKRALTDPHILSGIGNAYSDEILHAARLSPFKQTHALDDGELRRLHEAAKRTLSEWTLRLADEAGGAFPDKVTAFHDRMAVHGRYRQPCPVCGSAVQRVVYASNEANYCATCQTGGRLLADRSLSRLLKDDWPRTLEELERRRS